MGIIQNELRGAVRFAVEGVQKGCRADVGREFAFLRKPGDVDGVVAARMDGRGHSSGIQGQSQAADFFTGDSKRRAQLRKLDSTHPSGPIATVLRKPRMADFQVTLQLPTRLHSRTSKWT